MQTAKTYGGGNAEAGKVRIMPQFKIYGRFLTALNIKVTQYEHDADVSRIVQTYPGEIIRVGKELLVPNGTKWVKMIPLFQPHYITLNFVGDATHVPNTTAFVVYEKSPKLPRSPYLTLSLPRLPIILPSFNGINNGVDLLVDSSASPKDIVLTKKVDVLFTTKPDDVTIENKIAIVSQEYGQRDGGVKDVIVQQELSLRENAPIDAFYVLSSRHMASGGNQLLSNSRVIRADKGLMLIRDEDQRYILKRSDSSKTSRTQNAPLLRSSIVCGEGVTANPYRSPSGGRTVSFKLLKTVYKPIFFDDFFSEEGDLDWSVTTAIPAFERSTSAIRNDTCSTLRLSTLRCPTTFLLESYPLPLIDIVMKVGVSVSHPPTFIEDFIVKIGFRNVNTTKQICACMSNYHAERYHPTVDAPHTADRWVLVNVDTAKSDFKTTQNDEYDDKSTKVSFDESTKELTIELSKECVSTLSRITRLYPFIHVEKLTGSEDRWVKIDYIHCYSRKYEHEA